MDFWHARGIIHINYQLTGNLQKKNEHFWTEVLIPQKNGRVQTCVVVFAKFSELGLKVLHQPPYFPDLASIDYYLFTNLKKWLSGWRFGYDDIITQTNAYLEGQ